MKQDRRWFAETGFRRLAYSRTLSAISRSFSSGLRVDLPRPPRRGRQGPLCQGIYVPLLTPRADHRRGQALPAQQGNPEAKLLLMTHCFDDCGYGRVKIQTDALNARSQAAIAKLGARREGVLRRDVRREDGTFRDSVVSAS